MAPPSSQASNTSSPAGGSVASRPSTIAPPSSSGSSTSDTVIVGNWSGNPPSIPNSAGISSAGTPTGVSPLTAHAANDYLRELFAKRIGSFTYLKRAFSGKQSWFNTIRLSRRDLEAAFDSERMRKRTMRFTLLGLSLSSILDINSPTDFCRATLGLLAELDTREDENYKPKMSNFFRSKKAPKKSTTNQTLSDYAHEGSGEFSYLISPNVPFQLDYFQTFLTLCDMLCEVYHKMTLFLGPASSSTTLSSAGIHPLASTAFPAPPPSSGDRISNPVPGALDLGGTTHEASLSATTQDLLVKVDGKLKKITAQITKELDGLARHLIKEELAHLDPLMRDLGLPSSVGGHAPSMSTSSAGTLVNPSLSGFTPVFGGGTSDAASTYSSLSASSGRGAKSFLAAGAATVGPAASVEWEGIARSGRREETSDW